jgi:peptidyl-prolyl isomerase G (cyclophilin G)
MVQAGDFERFDGTGGYSPLWGNKFPDENLTGRCSKHDQAGVLSMANSGRDTNGSQFFITLQATPHLDGKHVVFGRVMSGMDSIMKMVQVERDARDRPVSLQKIVIADCGVGGINEETESRLADHRSKKHSKKKKKKRSRSKKRKYSDSNSSDSSTSSARNNKKRRRRDEDSSVSSTDSSSGNKRRRKKKHKSRKRKGNKRDRSDS